MAEVETPSESISLADAILLLDGPAVNDGQIAEYERMFSQRFSEDDAEFMKTVNAANPAPPCVENWYSRPKRTFDWSRGNSDQRGGYGGRGGGQRDYNRPWRGHDDRGHGYSGRGGGYGRDGDRGHHDNSQDHYRGGAGGGGTRVHYAGRREDSGERQSKYRHFDDGGQKRH